VSSGVGALDLREFQQAVFQVGQPNDMPNDMLVRDLMRSRLGTVQELKDGDDGDSHRWTLSCAEIFSHIASRKCNNFRFLSFLQMDILNWTQQHNDLARIFVMSLPSTEPEEKRMQSSMRVRPATLS
jgi:hypothetical protein